MNWNSRNFRGQKLRYVINSPFQLRGADSPGNLAAFPHLFVNRQDSAYRPTIRDARFFPEWAMHRIVIHRSNGGGQGHQVAGLFRAACRTHDGTDLRKAITLHPEAWEVCREYPWRALPSCPPPPRVWFSASAPHSSPDSARPQCCWGRAIARRF